MWFLYYSSPNSWLVCVLGVSSPVGMNFSAHQQGESLKVVWKHPPCDQTNYISGYVVNYTKLTGSSCNLKGYADLLMFKLAAVCRLGFSKFQLPLGLSGTVHCCATFVTVNWTVLQAWNASSYAVWLSSIRTVVSITLQCRCWSCFSAWLIAGMAF